MEILKNFGFEPILFIAQIINFLIIVYLLKRFLYKPVINMLEERQKKIAEGIKSSEEAEKKLQETIQKEETIIRKAQEEARKLIDDAKIEQAQMMQRAEEATQAKIDKMLQKAREQITFETAQTEKRLEAHISRLAVDFLQKSVQGLFGPKEQEMIMKNALQKIKKKVD